MRNNSPRFLPRRMLASTVAVLMIGGMMTAGVLLQAEAQMQLRGYVSQSVRQANRLFQLGKWEEAEQAYTQAVRRNPRDAKARAGLAIVQAELYKLGAAEENAKKVLQANPKDPYAHIALGIAYRNRTASSDMTWRSQREQLLEQAVNEFQTALRHDPGNPDAYNQLGEVYRMQGRLQEADEAFSKAIELDPKFSEALANKGTVLRDQGKLNEAVDHYRRAINLNSKNYKAHYFLGEALIDKGDYHKAYNSLNTALYQNRNSAMIHTKMGEALEKQGNESAAIAQYREAIRIKPEYTPAYQKLAGVFDKRGDGELAVSELRSALNANPKLDSLKLDLARLSLAVDKPDQALRYYNEVLQKDPSNPDALKGLAQTYLVTAQDAAGQGILGGSDKYVDAETAIRGALQANPNDIQLHLAMLQVKRLAGEPEAARSHYEFIASQPATTETERLAKGEALFALGYYMDSDQYFRQLLHQYGNDTDRKLLLADTLKINGDLDMANEVYSHILTADPNNLKAQRGIQRIGGLKEAALKQTRLADSLDNWYSKKQRKSARDFYLESVSLYPRQPEVRLALAKIYNREDEYGKAAIEYESYLHLMPDLDPKERESIRQKIARLKEKAGENGPTTAGTRGPGGIVTPPPASTSLPSF